MREKISLSVGFPFGKIFKRFCGEEPPSIFLFFLAEGAGGPVIEFHHGPANTFDFIFHDILFFVIIGCAFNFRPYTINFRWVGEFALTQVGNVLFGSRI